MPGAARRIARLSVAGGKRRGTGFAIDARHLLTAFHVVGHRPTGALEPGPITVAFQDDEDPARWVTTTAAVVPGEHDARDDWAVLACAADVPDAAPIALARPRAGYGDPWRSFGYPGPAADPGKHFDGDITAHEPTLQIFCKQSHQDARVPGLSGAPCLVGGRAIGLIVSASDPDDSGYNRDGAMFVRSLVTVAAACPRVRALLPAREPPFVPQVESELAGDKVVPLLPELRKLGWELPPVAAADRPQLAPRAAEHLLLAGPAGAVPALRMLYPLGLEPSVAILDFTASAWIDDDATARLAAAIRADRPRTIAGINAATPDLGRRYVHRAGYPTASHPGWLTTMAVLPDPAGERRDDSLLADGRAALRHLLGCDPDDPLDELDAAYAAHDHAGEPLVLVVPPPLPPAAAVARFHDAYPRVRLALLCGTRGLAELVVRFPDAVAIEPPVVDEQERRARDAHDAACLAITAFHRRRAR